MLVLKVSLIIKNLSLSASLEPLPEIKLYVKISPVSTSVAVKRPTCIPEGMFSLTVSGARANAVGASFTGSTVKINDSVSVCAIGPLSMAIMVITAVPCQFVAGYKVSSESLIAIVTLLFEDAPAKVTLSRSASVADITRLKAASSKVDLFPMVYSTGARFVSVAVNDAAAEKIVFPAVSSTDSPIPTQMVWA